MTLQLEVGSTQRQKIKIRVVGALNMFYVVIELETIKIPIAGPFLHSKDATDSAATLLSAIQTDPDFGEMFE